MRRQGHRRAQRRPRRALVLLAAGALATPHLLLASGLERLNPGARRGRPLPHAPLQRDDVRRSSRRARTRERRFHKQIAHPRLLLRRPGRRGAPAGKLGGMQQMMTPPGELVARTCRRGSVAARSARSPQHARPACSASPRTSRAPRTACAVDRGRRDAYGLPQLRDRAPLHRARPAARRALHVRAREAACCARPARSFFVHPPRRRPSRTRWARCGWATTRHARRSTADCRFRGLREPLRHRRQRASDLGRGEPQPDHRRQRPARGPAVRGSLARPRGLAGVAAMPRTGWDRVPGLRRRDRRPRQTLLRWARRERGFFASRDRGARRRRSRASCGGARLVRLVRGGDRATRAWTRWRWPRRRSFAPGADAGRARRGQARRASRSRPSCARRTSTTVRAAQDAARAAGARGRELLLQAAGRGAARDLAAGAIGEVRFVTSTR